MNQSETVSHTSSPVCLDEFDFDLKRNLKLQNYPLQHQAAKSSLGNCFALFAQAENVKAHRSPYKQHETQFNQIVHETQYMCLLEDHTCMYESDFIVRFRGTHMWCTQTQLAPHVLLLADICFVEVVASVGLNLYFQC